MKKTLAFFSSIYMLTVSVDTTGQTCTGNTTITKCIGTLDDGSGMAEYGDFLNCAWTIVNPLEVPMQVSFNSFMTEACCDIVSVYDGDSDLSPLIGTYSGVDLPPDFTTTNESFHITFTSNNILGFAGWSLSWNGTKKLTACSSIFTDGSGEQNYVNDQHSGWLISPPGASSITLSFPEFSTETKFDNVYVYDGPDPFSPLVAAINGTFTPDPITSTGGSLLVEFVSDLSGSSTGWSAHYTIEHPLLTSCIGEIDNVPDEEGYAYLPNEDCTWLIQPANASSITIHFTEMETEFSTDIITIYDGATTDDPVLATYSGSNIPPDVTSSGSSLLVRFVSDNNVELSGFSFGYECTPLAVKEVFKNSYVEIFPNPVNDELSFSLKEVSASAVIIEVRNNLGQVVIEQQKVLSNNIQSSINTSGLADGCYYLILKTKHQVIATRFIKGQ